jgi:Protein of unknown function (DUF1592)/Protein of unknown function (DUF1588)/Protein of unknown function (DUF1595)/Protein of unknown function (DUF1585)/Protein of unknown function (DUF1587)
MRSRWLLPQVVILAATGGCSGTVVDTDADPNARGGNGNTTMTGGAGGSKSSVCQPGQSAPYKLRRLTRSQLDNTVRDLLGTRTLPSAGLSPDEKSGAFYSNLTAPLDPLVVEHLQAMAETLAAESTPGKLAGCTTTDRVCAERFVADFGRRAFRRPLSQDESKRYLDFYDASLKTRTHDATLRLLVRAFLQSPTFLYHGEFGIETTPTRKLTAFELASRLSYFLWDTMPDEPLFTAAGSGDLDSSAGLRAQIARMLADNKAKETLRSFHFQWLELERIDGLNKSQAAFSNWSPALAAAMRDETIAFVEHVFGQGDGKLGTLLSAPISFPSASLTAVYGLQTSDIVSGEPTRLNPEQRAGLLTQGSFLAVHAHPDQSSPVRRGVVVRQRLLCQSLPDPPNNVNNNPPEPKADATTRERFAQHTADASCSSCHALIDPIGLGFENYDAIGKFRTTENGKPIDASGEVLDADDADGAFKGTVALAKQLAASNAVSECVARQWFNYALGRQDNAGDQCAVDALRDKFIASGGDMRGLIADIVLSPSFGSLMGFAAPEVNAP